MSLSESINILREIGETMLQKTGFSGTVEVTVEEGEVPTLWCALSVERDQHFLIGQYGVNLEALRYIVRALFRKRVPDRVNIAVDVNGYLRDKRELLYRDAEKAAQEALENNISVALHPMPAYERKIVHAYLARNPRLLTESVGVGADRKIMVKPRPVTDEPEAL